MTLGACERALPTATSAATAAPRADFAHGFGEFVVCSSGADGTYTVAVAGVLQPGSTTVLDGTCQVLYTYPSLTHQAGQFPITITRQAQSGVTLDSIALDSTRATLTTVLQTFSTLTGTDSVTSTVNNDVAAKATFYMSVTPSACGTLTIGYWKTHAGLGPQADAVTPLLPIWLGTSGGAKSVDVTTAAQAVFLLSNSGQASNPVNRLYAQLLAAKLNIASGVDGSAVATVIAAADTFLAQYDNTSSLTKAQIQMVNGWQTTLDNYNNGLIGPGHCSS
ncbi:MAG TPA: hypothetical protein VF832_06215 [Longimicrobiales bacterium]